MLISGIIQLLERIVADIQICRQTWRVVVRERRITQGEAALLIIGEARDFLCLIC